ncbi:heme-binding protein [Methylobacterium sp. ARG-1]|uniref:GlcG/HbpS family heme-binding protein n=1 Tax=Methylobacterium sp. ARG-1 TaxID=1692501 RepID=UPI003297A7AC
MPAPTRPAARLTHAAALTVLQAVIARAEAIGVPENVAVVDADGNVLAFLRMEGAKLLSRESARAKAVTAASNGAATGRLPADLAVTVALASGGRLTDLPGACRS